MTGTRVIDIMTVEIPGSLDQPICAAYDDGDRVVASINARYPWAEDHLRAHVVQGFDTILLCRVDCNVTQR
jgi:hypothetical protein